MCIIIMYNAVIIQYIMVLRPSNIDSCTDLFKKLNILPLQSKYMLSLLLVVNNKDNYEENSEIHSINTRQNSNLNQIYQCIKKEYTILASRSSTISLPIPKTCQ